MGNLFTTDYETKEAYQRSFARNHAFDGSIKGGPLALGDPDDNYLYRKEIMYGIPAKRREIILNEYCSKPQKDFEACQTNNKLLTRFRCKNEVLQKNQCVHKFWDLPGLEERAHNEYLADRSLYRLTGDSKAPKSSNTFSLERKSWEEYKATKDEKVTFWNIFKNVWEQHKPSHIPVEVDSKPLNDT